MQHLHIVLILPHQKQQHKTYNLTSHCCNNGRNKRSGRTSGGTRNTSPTGIFFTAENPELGILCLKNEKIEKKTTYNELSTRSENFVLPELDNGRYIVHVIKQFNVIKSQ